MRRVILIDADTLVYKAGQKVERPTEWGNDLWTLHAYLDEGIFELDQLVGRIKDELKGDHIVMALSDYGSTNWRMGVYPEYKSTRQGTNKRRPILWRPLREYIHEMHGEAWDTYQKPTLEGDDVLGILLTHPTLIKGEKICVSIDKDMKTLPGLHVNYDHGFAGEGTLADHVFEVSEEEADFFHMLQALAGDPTDGYPGCPGVGMTRAEKYLREGLKQETYEHTFTRGARKGDTEWRTRDGEPGTLWEVLLSIYEGNGLGEKEALENARVARICRADDYDFKNQEVRLWTPMT